MAKNRIKSNRVSALKSFSEDLPSPEEIEKKVEEVTTPAKVTTPTPQKVVKTKPDPTKTASTKKKEPKKKVAAQATERVKFVKIGGAFHRLAKIEAAKNSLSLKAYLEMLIENNSSS